MTHRDLLCKIKKLGKIEPEEAWINSTRSFVLDYARIQEEKQKKALFYNPRLSLGEKVNSAVSLFRQRLAFKAASIAVVLIVAGNFAAAKASESLPGESLYPVKLLAEKAELALTFDEDKRIALKFELAERRLNEFSFLMEKGRVAKVNDPVALSIAMNGFKNQLSAAVSESDGSKSPRAPGSGAKAPPAPKTTTYAKKINQKVQENIQSAEEKTKLIEEKVLAVMTGKGGALAESGNRSAAKLLEEAKGVLLEAKADLAGNDPNKALEKIVVSNEITKAAEKIVDTAIAENDAKIAASQTVPAEPSPSVTPTANPSPSPAIEPSTIPVPVSNPSPTPQVSPSSAPTPSIAPAPSPSAVPTASPEL